MPRRAFGYHASDIIDTTVRFVLLASIYLPLYAQNCAPAPPLAPNDVQSGRLDETSCQLSDGTSYVDYLATFPVRGALTLAVKGADGLIPSVILRNQNGNRVVPGGAGTAGRYVESGVYHVIVNSASAGPGGGYTLTSAFVPEPGALCKTSRNMGTARPVTGRLSAASCKLPDGSVFDSWQISVYGAGTLNLSIDSTDFATYLILRGPDGMALATGNSRMGLDVPGNETYTVIAAASDASQKGGAYRLAGTFTPAEGETCIAQGAFSVGSPVTGSVSGGSCNFDLPGRQDSALFNFYDLHVDKTGVAQLQVTSSSFSPLLLLLDANGNEITEDAESSGSGMPLIQQKLNPGDYRLLIFNEDSFEGQYTIQYDFAPGSGPSCPVQSLAAGLPLAGALSSTYSCRAAGSMADLYQVVLPQTGTFNINMSSSDFTTFLILRDAKDNVIDYGVQTPDGYNSNASLNLPAGTYYIAASSANLPGNYQIAYDFNLQNLPVCGAPQNLPVNSGFVSNLGPGSCTGPDGQYVDAYQFKTPADGTVAAVMMSSALPSLLSLSDAQGNVMRTDAGSYSEGNSILVQYLKAGTYRLEARSDEYNLSGRYRINALFTASTTKPNACAPVPLQLGTPRLSSLAYTSCQYYDNTFADFYSFSIAGPAKPVSILASSSAFDLSLLLIDAKGNILTASGRSGGSADSQIIGMLASGTYYAVVKPSADPSSTGAYTISVKQ